MSDGRGRRSALPAIRKFGEERFESVHQLPDGLAAESPQGAGVLTMRVVLGLKVEQIAELFEICPTTVKVRWRVGLARLRTRLAESWGA